MSARRTQGVHHIACRIKHNLVCRFNRVSFFYNILFGKIRVLKCVVADFAAKCHHSPRNILHTILFEAPTTDEEGGPSMILLQNVKYLIGDTRHRAVVKGQRDHGLIWVNIHLINRNANLVVRSIRRVTFDQGKQLLVTCLIPRRIHARHRRGARGRSRTWNRCRTWRRGHRQGGLNRRRQLHLRCHATAREQT